MRRNHTHPDKTITCMRCSPPRKMAASRFPRHRENHEKELRQRFELALMERDEVNDVMRR